MSENKDFLDEFYKDEDSTGQTGDLASGGASGDMGDDFLFGSSFVERVDADGNTIGGQSSPQLGEQQPIQPDLTSEEKVQHIARTEKTGRTARTLPVSSSPSGGWYFEPGGCGVPPLL